MMQAHKLDWQVLHGIKPIDKGLDATIVSLRGHKSITGWANQLQRWSWDIGTNTNKVCFCIVWSVIKGIDKGRFQLYVNPKSLKLNSRLISINSLLLFAIPIRPNILNYPTHTNDKSRYYCTNLVHHRSSVALVVNVHYFYSSSSPAPTWGQCPIKNQHHLHIRNTISN